MNKQLKGEIKKMINTQLKKKFNIQKKEMSFYNRKLQQNAKVVYIINQNGKPESVEIAFEKWKTKFYNKNKKQVNIFDMEIAQSKWWKEEIHEIKYKVFLTNLVYTSNFIDIPHTMLEKDLHAVFNEKVKNFIDSVFNKKTVELILIKTRPKTKSELDAIKEVNPKTIIKDTITALKKEGTIKFKGAKK